MTSLHSNPEGGLPVAIERVFGTLFTVAIIGLSCASPLERYDLSTNTKLIDLARASGAVLVQSLSSHLNIVVFLFDEMDLYSAAQVTIQNKLGFVPGARSARISAMDWPRPRNWHPRDSLSNFVPNEYRIYLDTRYDPYSNQFSPETILSNSALPANARPETSPEHTRGATQSPA
ncbi:uncharacterized protein JCM15063_004577 [Sporobolomyces koalae]|uniref:uncharacterized protein n=1 Tax=Sporobolomyces koalae TaxID=500713 RepID=UPI00316FBE4A